jgi:ABC-type nitrate/sulfonate/bicarbonate transport system substrate-binding protein
MRRTFLQRWLGLAVSGAVLAAACTAAATPVPTAAPTAAPTAGPTAAPGSPTPTAMPGTKNFNVVFTSVGLSSAPMLAAIDTLRTQGYSIDVAIIESSELVVQGVASGQFAFGSGANNSVLAAIEKGGPTMKGLMARVANEWTVYARTATIKSCADLGGKRLAIHSAGAVSTAMVKNYISTNCPGTNPEYVTIAGSPNRVAALLADQIDATPAELSDTFTIDQQAADRFSLLTSFAKDLPKLQPTDVHVNSAFATANPGTVYAMVKAIITEYRRIGGKPDLLKADAEKYVKEAIDPKTIDAASKRYSELKMFPPDGGNTRENMQYTHDFFKAAGVIKADIPLNNWTDLTYLEQVLKELGPA